VTEQRLVFGEIAEQYDEARPTYPPELFDTVTTFGALAPGDRALEIGAGTGKATTAWIERGLRVHALEPSGPMADVLRAKGVDAEVATFEEWRLESGAFRLVCAAQAWHWVHSPDRYERVAAALGAGGTVAFFWNKGRALTGALRRDNDAVYKQYAPEMAGSVGDWSLDWVAEQLDASGAFTPTVRHTFTWGTRYTSAEWVRLLGTHSDHRMLGEEQRNQLHAAVGDVIDRHGGHVEVVYDANLYMARRGEDHASS